MNVEISIVVPCYNQAQFLDDTLKSVLNQTLSNWECIIVNDGSPDNTDEVASKWIELDYRFKYVSKQNAGLASARNTGIDLAVGKYILPLDSDDRISSNYLELALSIFKNNNNVKVVYCRANYFGDLEGEWELDDFSLYNLAIRNVIFCSAVFIKQDWERVGGFDSEMKYGLEDWEFWISILKDGGDVIRLSEVCFFYRVKGISMVKSLKDEQLKEMYDYMSIKHAAFFVQELGSFKYLISENFKLAAKLRSQKFLLNQLIFKTLGFRIFKNEGHII